MTTDSLADKIATEITDPLVDTIFSLRSRAAQLEGERDAARQELRELQSHHTSIVLALYEIDEEVFGPLTVKEGIAELKQQRDTARAAIGRYQDERVMLLSRIEALVAELQEQEARDNPYILHGEELKRATEARIAGRP